MLQTLQLVSDSIFISLICSLFMSSVSLPRHLYVRFSSCNRTRHCRLDYSSNALPLSLPVVPRRSHLGNVNNYHPSINDLQTTLTIEAPLHQKPIILTQRCLGVVLVIYLPIHLFKSCSSCFLRRVFHKGIAFWPFRYLVHYYFHYS